MKKNDNVFEEIKKLVYKERWKYKQELTRNTRLLDDLRIDGDDADDFFHAFKERFKVDLSSLDLRKYFNPEGFDPIGLSVLISKIRGKKFPKISEKPITLGDLEIAVKMGKWIDPE